MSDTVNNGSDDTLDDKSLAAITSAIKPAVLTDQRKQAMRDRLFSRIKQQVDATAAPANTITRRAADMQWMSILPKVEVKVLRYDREQQNQTVLVKLQAGAVFPGHAHSQEEECLVLEGNVKIGEHALYEGDMHIAKPGCVHGNITTETGAILFIRSEIVELPGIT